MSLQKEIEAHNEEVRYFSNMLGNMAVLSVGLGVFEPFFTQSGGEIRWPLAGLGLIFAVIGVLCIRKLRTLEAPS